MAILLAGTHVDAQYKKASFLSRSGRTYDVGFSGRFLGDGGTLPGVYYSYGSDRGKRIFHWFDLELLLPTKFSYQTVDKSESQIPVTVTGKSKLGLVYRYNFACYLTDVENSESKFKPFATLGINFLFFGGTAKSYEVSPEYANPTKMVGTSNFSYGANAGLGGIYELSDKLGLKVVAGYNMQGVVDGNDYISEGYTTYKVLPSHPYITVGLRFLMVGD
jgi:hypothetical protein